MKILVAPSSFKESLNSCDIAKYIRTGLQKASKKFDITELPLADGGTGTAYILTRALDGQFIKCKVTGPLNKGVEATYGIVPQQKLAIIELAEAAGLRLVPHKKRNPLVTTTQGVGELIVDAVQRGYK
ncbi:MAG: glycerate kinase, partial [candidate division WOR-3 bacterium]